MVNVMKLKTIFNISDGRGCVKQTRGLVKLVRAPPHELREFGFEAVATPAVEVLLAPGAMPLASPLVQSILRAEPEPRA
jgi:hypothetical protein